ncbi:huntingtin-interacting protein 1-like isoform X2 [Daphnia carinata]|uniref:huntingtin-interacting protein 1-like isoform X2 n=1 Tax=Daphnia carinata TaxID=120202 RepID=UPI002868ABF3|nr:huntingtin-interacting protein 1-like isoform X2 [Daphnia carinata]
MAGRTLPPNRSRTSLDQERENFEKTQTLAICKAVNESEVPVKSKHVRSAIIGTFQGKGSQAFWSIILRLPIHSNPIVAWKFCNTLHKILREGHPNVLKDSQQHRDFLVDKGKLWGHFKEGYGKLIYVYCRLLVVKLDFHKRNQKFPGNLMLKDEEIDLVCEHDINLYFQLSVELLDYMDEILSLQTAVFGSLDMSRSNSMTNAGQCRLAPLIPCIQDSSQVYDFIVKLLFKLHNCLPPDTLEGHRIRFQKQFKALRQFYLQSSTLQYFKSLIQVPNLDENPPNFLISSELSRHVTPVVILPNETFQPSHVDETLVQLESDLSESNECSPDLLLERDRYIEHLLHQLEQLSAELRKVRAEYNQETGILRQELLNMEIRLSEKENEIQEAMKDKETIERKLSEAAKSAQMGSVVQLQLDETEKRAKGWEDKFVKLKEVYQKLRDEHIKLLRHKAEIDKKFSVANAALEQSQKIQCELQDSLQLSKASIKETENEFNVLRTADAATIQKLNNENVALQEINSQLNTSLSTAEQKIAEAENLLSEFREQNNKLVTEVQLLNATLKLTAKEREEIANDFEQLKVRAANIELEFSAFKTSQDATILQLMKEKEELSENKINLQEKYENLEECFHMANKQINDVQEEKKGLALLTVELKKELELTNQTSIDLKEALNQSIESSKKMEQEYSDYKIIKEAVILDVSAEKEKLKSCATDMKESVSMLEKHVQNLESENAQLQEETQKLLHQKDLLSTSYKSELHTSKLKSINLFHQLLINCCLKAEQYLGKCVTDLSKPPVFALNVQDHGGSTIAGAVSLLETLSESLCSYCSNNKNEEIACFTIPLIFPFVQSVDWMLLHGQQLAHSLTDIDKVDDLLKKCVAAGKVAVLFFKVLQQPFEIEEINLNSNKVKDALRDLEKEIEFVMESSKNSSEQGNVGEELENELGAMERAIEEAAARIAQLWDNSKKSHTGVKLEVSEKVLDSCTALMKAIVELIRNAKVLQEEIVARGKGSASARDFYKRNHRWTEGLLSAAKAVGFGAKLLTDAADNVVKGQAKFEQLTVASQEIAASTAQLVFASRVKAELQSKNLQILAESSKGVSLATGRVVATAKHCAQLVEESTVLDFAHLTLHQAKRLEMESQVKVLEFESLLEKERLRLSALRKQHYQLAGDAES